MPLRVKPAPSTGPVGAPHPESWELMSQGVQWSRILSEHPDPRTLRRRTFPEKEGSGGA